MGVAGHRDAAMQVRKSQASCHGSPRLHARRHAGARKPAFLASMASPDGGRRAVAGGWSLRRFHVVRACAARQCVIPRMRAGSVMSIANVEISEWRAIRCIPRRIAVRARGWGCAVQCWMCWIQQQRNNDVPGRAPCVSTAEASRRKRTFRAGRRSFAHSVRCQELIGGGCGASGQRIEIALIGCGYFLIPGGGGCATISR